MINQTKLKLTAFVLLVLTLILPTASALLYDSASSDHISTSFNSTDTLFSFNTTGYYRSGTSPENYSLNQKLYWGITDVNFSFSTNIQAGAGNNIIFSFGDGVNTTLQLPDTTCGASTDRTGFEVTNNGFIVVMHRDRNKYCIYNITNGATTLLATETISALTENQFYPFNLTYNNTLVTWNFATHTGSNLTSSYALSNLTHFAVSTFVGATNGQRMGIQDIYVTLNLTNYNLAIDNCTTGTNHIYNFTLVDEATQALITNGTLDIAVNLYNANRSTSIETYSAIYTLVNNTQVCVNGDVPAGTTYSVDLIVRYETDGTHAIEYYNIVNDSLTNTTALENITLYDLNLTDSTEFQLTYTGSNYLPLEDALVYVNRQYLSENTFKTVELPKTDYNGQTILHLVRNDVLYNIIVMKEGEVLGTFTNLIAFCDDYTIGDCNIELNSYSSSGDLFDFSDYAGITFSDPTYNSSADTISFTYVSSNGLAKAVSLNVTRNDIFGNISICNTSTTSASATLTCNIDPNIDDTMLIAEIYVANVLIARYSIIIDNANLGIAGYLLMFVLALSLALMFSGSKIGVLISIPISFGASIGLGFTSGTMIGTGATGLWLLLLVIFALIKLNQGGSD